MSVKQALKIHLVAASNLKAADFASNSSDPFVRVYWQGDQNSRDVIESRVENNTVNPIWNQDMHIEWKPERKTLIFDVYDKDITSDDYLGRAVIPIENMMATNTSYYLKPRVGMGDTDITGYLVLRFQMPDAAGHAGLFRTLTRATSANGLSNIATSHLDAIDSSLSSYPIFQVLEEKTGVPRAKLVAASVMFLLFFVVFGYGSRAACLLVGALYPVYASFKAVKSVGKEDDAQWLMYWIVYGLFLVLESFADLLLFWIPFYYFFKFLILLWLMHPETRGAGQIYLFIISPMLSRYSAQADKYLAGSVAGGNAYGGNYGGGSYAPQSYAAPQAQNYNSGPSNYQTGASNAGNVVRF